MIILLALLAVPVWAMEPESDPRLDCAHRLEIARPLIERLIKLDVLTALEADHTAIVEGTLTERARSANPVTEEVVVLVRPSGHVIVFGKGDTGSVVLRGAQPGRRVRVPSFRNQLRVTRAGEWYWRRPDVPSLNLGDVPKAEFLDRAEAAVRELMRLNVLTLDGIRLGHVFRGTYRGVAYDVLHYPIVTDDDDGVVVFAADTGERAAIEPNVAARKYILLQSGERVGRRGESWVTLPAVGWMHDPEEVGTHPSVRAFVIAHPTALDDLLFRDAPIRNVDFVTSEVQSATDEVSGEEFLLLSARDGDGETMHYFMFDPRARAWVDETSFGTRTFRLAGWARLGVNLPGLVYRELPPAGEFERTRALFDPPREF